jgi:hypothetical protein
MEALEKVVLRKSGNNACGVDGSGKSIFLIGIRSASRHLGTLHGKLLCYYGISVPYRHNMTCIQ